MSNSIVNKTVAAAKWSTISEIVTKCITPVTNMILARILAPEAFGVLATVQMVVAFAEVFIDSGFQKYLIQHQFSDPHQERRYMSVAFWANLAVSLVIWALIALFNAPLATLVGDPGRGHLLVVTGVMIPLHSVAAIQSCKIKKDLNFKKLFRVRVVAAFVPLLITVPLALLGLDYWALIIGNIAGGVIQSLMLTLMRSFKPTWFFSWEYLKEMMNYGMWTLINGFAVWLAAWIDTFLIGRALSDYYLGLYKNSISIINNLFAIIIASITPVLFSSLSKLQDDDENFKKVYLGIQRTLSLLVIPLGVGAFLYQDFVTLVLLGDQWAEAAAIMGINALTMVFRRLFVSINGDVYRAKGHVKVPLFIELIDIFLSIPVCIFVLHQFGFWTFVYTKALLRLVLMIPEFILLKQKCNIGFSLVAKNVGSFFLAAAVMSAGAVVLKMVSDSFVWNIVSIIVCAGIYFAVLLMIPKERHFVVDFVNKKLKKKAKKTAP